MSEVMTGDDFLDDENDGSNVVKELRKALKASQKQVKDLESQLGEIRSADRKSVIEGVLSESGVPVGIAKFIPDDVVTKEDVDSWLEENAELFGLTKADTKDSAEIQAASRMAKLGDQAGSVDPGDILSRIASATSEEELNEALFGTALGPVG